MPDYNRVINLSNLFGRSSVGTHYRQADYNVQEDGYLAYTLHSLSYRTSPNRISINGNLVNSFYTGYSTAVFPHSGMIPVSKGDVITIVSVDPTYNGESAPELRFFPIKK